MAYRTIDENRVPSGIVFFGPTAADQTFESDSSLLFDSGTETLYLNNLNVAGLITGGGGGISVSGDTGTTQNISHNDTLLILGGNSLSSVASDTDTITISVDDGGINTTQLADSSVTEAKINRTVGSYSSTTNITHDIALATAGAGGITLTLPPVSTGKIVVVKKVDSAEGVVTIDSSGVAETVDGATGGKTLYYEYESMHLVSDGTNWFVV